MQKTLVAALSLAAIALGCTRQEAQPGSPAQKAATATGEHRASEDASSAPPRAGDGPRFVGRWIADGSGMRCGWSGCYVVARFRGASISARIQDEGSNLFQVVVDGEPRGVLRTDKNKGEAVYPLVEGLADAVHEVLLYRRTEALLGEVVVYGLEPSKGGALLAPASRPARHIELIGDSITTGYGNEGPGPKCTFLGSQESAFAAYGALAARSLGADHTAVAWSGKTIREMTAYFDKALPKRKDGPLWDFSQLAPAVVVINLGTNDFANVDPGETRFVRAYRELVTAVRAAYPRALIVCALGPMLTNIYPPGRQTLTKARRYMKAVVATLRESGDANVELLEFPELNHADGLGCGFHPGLTTHRLMGEQLAAFLRERLGW